MKVALAQRGRDVSKDYFETNDDIDVKINEMRNRLIEKQGQQTDQAWLAGAYNLPSGLKNSVFRAHAFTLG